MKKSEYNNLAIKLFDIIAAAGKSSAENAAKIICLPTEAVLHILETLLDCSLLQICTHKNETLYSVHKNIAFLLLDAGKDSFSASVMTVNGDKKSVFNFHRSESHLFDENLSFFLREALFFFSRGKIMKFTGICLMLPDTTPSLSSHALITEGGRTKLHSILNENFQSNIIIIDRRSSLAAAALTSENSGAITVVINEHGSSVSYACADGIIRKHSEKLFFMSGRNPHLCINENKSKEENALIAADGAVNLIALLSPRKILFDVPPLYGNEGKDAILNCLGNKFGFTPTNMPEIITESTDFYCAKGAAMLLCRTYVRSALESRHIFKRK